MSTPQPREHEQWMTSDVARLAAAVADNAQAQQALAVQVAALTTAVEKDVKRLDKDVDDQENRLRTVEDEVLELRSFAKTARWALGGMGGLLLVVVAFALPHLTWT